MYELKQAHVKLTTSKWYQIKPKLSVLHFLPSLPVGCCCSLPADRGGCNWTTWIRPRTVNSQVIGEKKYKGCSTVQQKRAWYKEHDNSVDESARHQTNLLEHIPRQADHGKIVKEENSFQINGFPVFHQSGSGPGHTEVDQYNDYYWDRRVHQQPWVRSLIWNIMEYYVIWEPGEDQCLHLLIEFQVETCPRSRSFQL